LGAEKELEGSKVPDDAYRILVGDRRSGAFSQEAL
jgi:hypothetical protein